jgi:hypothetical protein
MVPRTTLFDLFFNCTGRVKSEREFGVENALWGAAKACPSIREERMGKPDAVAG